MKAIEARDVSFTYSDGTTGLKNVSFEVNRGEKVCLIGPNGAGKSTLLLCLLGFLRFTGEIKIAGIRVEGSNLDEVRRKAGIVFQDPDDQIFMPSVIEDVLFGPRNIFKESEAHQHAQRAIEITGLEGFEKRLAHHLSFGEKKRVAIAGALAMNPEILLLDEPTSNLDHLHRNKLIFTLRKLDRTLLIATHDMNLVCDIADRIIVLSQGSIVADGAALDIITDGELLRSVHLEPPCSCTIENLRAKL